MTQSRALPTHSGREKSVKEPEASWLVVFILTTPKTPEARLLHAKEWTSYLVATNREL